MFSIVEVLNLYPLKPSNFYLVIRSHVIIELINVDDYLCMIPTLNQPVDHFYLYQLK